MGTLLNRRRYMGGGDKCPYVTDGLQHWFDGINKGGNSDGWTDLIDGTLKFMYNEHSAIESDCVHMDGEGSIMLNTNAKLCPMRSQTLEVVAENVDDSTDGAIYNSGWQDYSSCLLVSDGYFLCPTGWTDVKWVTTEKPHKFVLTISNRERFLNMEKYTDTLRYGAYTTTKNASIGGLLTDRFINCRVYCIRIYNRLLTDSEVLANQSVDNERFNLGLNI